MISQPAPTIDAPLDVSDSLRLTMILVANDEEMARECEKVMARQHWADVRVLFPVAHAINEARVANVPAIFMAQGTTLAPFALERAWWVLHSNPQVGFVAFADERGSATPMLESVANCVVARGGWLTDGAAGTDARWPGIAPLFGMLEHHHRGQLVREPLLVRSEALKDSNAPFMRAVLELRAKGITDALLGDAGMDPVLPLTPLQSLDERALPESPVRARVTEGKRRVLALLQGFPMGGYTAFNTDFLPRLVKKGHALTVCTTEVWRSEWRLDHLRSATDDVVHAAGIVPLASMPRFVSSLIASRGIDVVLVSHAMAAYRMLPWLRRQHPDVAFVDYVHTDWFEAEMYGSYAAMGAAHSEWLDAQMASSKMLARDLVRRGANAERVSAVTINLDVDDWNPSKFPGDAIRKTLGCKASQRLILFAGRLSSEKRPLLAVECWRALVASGVDARFAIAGSGPLLAQTVDAIAASGLTERVEMLGELDGDMLRYVYSAADVYHAPSEIEGIARSLYEAMAMQCVPVVADVGGQSELVTPECGVLVPHGENEVERYVAALTAAVSSSSMARQQKASRARIVQHFNSAQCVAGFESAFEAAVAQRASARSAGASIDSAAAAREMALGGLEIARRHYWRAARR
jgi:glycosyltransferase involved in cell wall biosynthesis